MRGLKREVKWFFFLIFIFFSFIFSWRLITLQCYSGFCHTLTRISHGFTCVPHPNPPSRLPPHPIPLGLPSAPALSTCLMHFCVKVLVAQWSPTLCNPMNYSPPSSSVCGILQARILGWVAILFSRGSSWPRDQTWSPTLQGDSFPSEPSDFSKSLKMWILEQGLKHCLKILA